MAEATVCAVQDCRGCPFCDAYEQCSAAARKMVPRETQDLPPSWCPLRAGPVVVRLREGT